MQEIAVEGKMNKRTSKQTNRKRDKSNKELNLGQLVFTLPFWWPLLVVVVAVDTSAIGKDKNQHWAIPIELRVDSRPGPVWYHLWMGGKARERE